MLRACFVCVCSGSRRSRELEYKCCAPICMLNILFGIVCGCVFGCVGVLVITIVIAAFTFTALALLLLYNY